MLLDDMYIKLIDTRGMIVLLGCRGGRFSLQVPPQMLLTPKISGIRILCGDLPRDSDSRPGRQNHFVIRPLIPVELNIADDTTDLGHSFINFVSVVLQNAVLQVRLGVLKFCAMFPSSWARFVGGSWYCDGSCRDETTFSEQRGLR